MLKIKDNVDLKGLEKYGYKQGKDMLHCSYSAYGKIFDKQKDNVLKITFDDPILVIQIDKEKREIELSVTTEFAFREFCYNKNEIVKPYIEDLIKADLVEKVEG